MYSKPVEILFHTFNLIYGTTLIVSILLYNIPLMGIVDTFTNVYCSVELTKRNKLILRFVNVGIQILISFCFPDFASILSIAGCICSVTLGFIIPYLLNYDVLKET